MKLETLRLKKVQTSMPVWTAADPGDTSMELNKSTTAFLACHWENDVVGSDGAFAAFYRARLEEHGVIPVAKRLIDSARRSGIRVVYTRVAFAEGHRDLVPNIPLLGIVAQQQAAL
jgi:nicotinamidase-related amidase